MENNPSLTILVLLILSTATTSLVTGGLMRTAKVILSVAFVSAPLITILWLLVQVGVIPC